MNCVDSGAKDVGYDGFFLSSLGMVEGSRVRKRCGTCKRDCRVLLKVTRRQPGKLRGGLSEG